jgi:hypothetical protein
MHAFRKQDETTPVVLMVHTENRYVALVDGYERTIRYQNPRDRGTIRKFLARVLEARMSPP